MLILVKSCKIVYAICQAHIVNHLHIPIIHRDWTSIRRHFKPLSTAKMGVLTCNDSKWYLITVYHGICFEILPTISCVCQNVRNNLHIHFDEDLKYHGGKSRSGFVNKSITILTIVRSLLYHYVHNVYDLRKENISTKEGKENNYFDQFGNRKAIWNNLPCRKMQVSKTFLNDSVVPSVSSNSSQLAKLKKSIPLMLLPWNFRIEAVCLID